MILTYERFLIGGVLLCEVETEEEAFFEMRRFLKVNRIISDKTTVKTFYKTDGNDPELMRKEITMTHGCSDVAVFGIYYKGSPNYGELGDESDWGIDRTVLLKGQNINYRYCSSKNCFVCWYDEVAAYLADLKTRKAGSMQCR